MNHKKVLSTIGAIFAWGLMGMILFTGGRTTGDAIKSLMYALSVGNTIISTYVCCQEWKE